ncbi:MAG: Nramp family divalent metal transporter [Ignavibacteriae bacterium]|nr:Nramp family divalent metal transporter [Ignavibacteriota bacterium]
MKLSSLLKSYGPGIAVAATGVGAGDLVAASVAGAKFGTVILWAAVCGAVVKFALNEGVARWQLATGTTVIEAWFTKFPRIVSYYFLVYLILWSFIVAAALISACGLAGHAVFPQLSVTQWGIIHSVLGAVLVYVGRYKLFERLMEIFTALMFITVLYCAVMLAPNLVSLIPSLVVPSIPEGSGKFILGVIGGVGGSVTLLSYGYWMREKNWSGREFHPHAQRDLGVAYTLSGLFGVAMMIIAAGVNPSVMTGDTMALEVADRIGAVLGSTGKWMFLLGFWGAVSTSLFGVWQSVPYFFVDCVNSLKSKSLKSKVQNSTTPLLHDSTTPDSTSADSPYYKAFLAFLTFPPMLFLLFGKPVWIIIAYAVVGAFFMPFLAGTLLYLNNSKQWVNELKNRRVINALLILSLLLFGYLAITEIQSALS